MLNRVNVLSFRAYPYPYPYPYRFRKLVEIFLKQNQILPRRGDTHEEHDADASALVKLAAI